MPVGLYAGANVSNGNGVTVAFPYNFKILDQTHIEVKVDGVLKAIGTDYTVTGVGLSNGGNVVFLVAPANGTVVQRARKVPYKRDQDYQYNGDLREEVVDPDFDTVEMQVQQIAADVARAFKAPLSVTTDMVFGDADWAARAGKHMRMKVDGSGPEFVSIDVTGGTFTATGVGAMARSWTAKVGELTVSVKDFGAVGDGIIDDAPAIAKAVTAAGVGGEVFFPKTAANYLCNSPIAQLQSQKWRGQGGQRGTTLKKGFNGDLITMGSLGEISDFNLDGNGGVYTGKNIVVPVGCFSPKMSRIRTISTQGNGIYFAADAGGGAVMSEIEGDTTNPLVVGVIGLAGDVGATPRFLRDSWFAGTCVDISGCNDFFVSSVYCNRIITSATSTNFYLSNVRYALGGVPMTIKGVGGQFTNCAFAGAITLQNAQGLVFDPTCEFAFGVVEDAATCLFNSFFTQSTAYNPVWTNAAGVQPALGNGTLTGRYIRQGRRCSVQIELTMGGTTTFGNAVSAYQWSLPFNSHNAYTQNCPLVAVVSDVSALAEYNFLAQIAADTAVCLLATNGGAVRDGTPIAWANGDKVTINLDYSTK